MEEDIRKQGILFLQQQRFGKRWKRVWCVLYRESSCSISRLDFFECKDGGNVEKMDKSLRKHQEHKKVIRLSDCIRVTEVEMDGCPKDTGSFLVETTDKIYVFACDRNQLDDWTHKLCEVAFPMSWMDHGVKRGSLQRGSRVEEDEMMEQNSLYSGRETVSVHDFRVCVRRTDASDRCRLKGDGVLRTDIDALHLLDKAGDILYTWPYRYLRRFGRDKSTFSFEAGRRCDSGEGSFEFDTKQGNFLFQAVEAAINLQKISLPHRQTSGGGQGSPENPPPPPFNPPPPYSRTQPLPQPRGQVPQPPAAQSRLEPPVDKMLTAVKSLTLDTRGLPVPQKNQVKMISSCPLPNIGPESSSSVAPAGGSSHSSNPRTSPRLSSTANQGQMYSQITLPADTSRGTKKEKRSDSKAPPFTPPLTNKESEYSQPFDTIASNVMSDILNSQGHGGELGADPLYDSIDEMKIRNIFKNEPNSLGPTYRKVDHIYDEPEGCAAATGKDSTPAVYDDPEEMRGDAWRIMGTTADPKGHEYPYNPRVDDYAVPKRAQRAFAATRGTTEEEEQEDEQEEEQEEEEEDNEEHSPYNNVMVKIV
ncbi:docking protein 2 isoform X2 [Leuresthes tenuis]|uniref:docking protein 2 isoform X2 n=1 Tax=Leuresthes tenuis TaxID=355514 RepID=UPI003B501A75